MSDEDSLPREVIEACIEQLGRITDFHIRMGVLQYLTFVIQAEYYEQQSEVEPRTQN